MARFTTAGKIVNRAALELGLIKSTGGDPFASNDGNLVQLCGLLTAQGREHAQAEHVWQQLRREVQYVTGTGEHGAVGSGEYALPDDYDRLVPATFWDRTNQRPVKLLSPLEWQALRAAMTVNVGYIAARMDSGLMRLYPISPPVGWTLVFEYVSTNWAIPAAVPPADYVAITAGATEVLANADVVLFDESLMVASIKLAFKEAKGFDTVAALDAYRRAYDRAKTRALSPSILDYTGNDTDDQFDVVLPNTGWGQ
jgi:hypothetical protein